MWERTLFAFNTAYIFRWGFLNLFPNVTGGHALQAAAGHVIFTETQTASRERRDLCVCVSNINIMQTLKCFGAFVHCFNVKFASDYVGMMKSVLYYIPAGSRVGGHEITGRSRVICARFLLLIHWIYANTLKISILLLYMKIIDYRDTKMSTITYPTQITWWVLLYSHIKHKKIKHFTTTGTCKLPRWKIL